MEGKARTVPLLETQIIGIVDVALDRADPALGGANHRHRLTLDHGLNRHVIKGRGFTDHRATGTQFGILPEFLLQLCNLVADCLPAARGFLKQIGKISLFGAQRIMLLADFKLFQLAQGTQAHIEDRLGLHIGQVKGGNQACLGIILFPDDTDHLIKIEIGNQITAEHFQTMRDLVEAMAGPADQHLMAVIEE